MQHKYEPGVAAAQASLALDSENAKANNVLSLCLLDLDRPAEAEAPRRAVNIRSLGHRGCWV